MFAVSIFIALTALIACTLPGVMTVIGVGLSLLSLFLASFTISSGSVKYLVTIMFIVTFNIFVVSEVSQVTSKYLYENNQKLITYISNHIYDSNYDEKIKEKRKHLDTYLGASQNRQRTMSDKTYWVAVKNILLTVSVPYISAFIALFFSLITSRTKTKI